MIEDERCDCDHSHELGVPGAHFASCIVEWSINGVEVAEFFVFQCLDEFLTGHAVASFDIEGLLEFAVEVVIPFHIVAAMQDYWFRHYWDSINAEKVNLSC
jgi:hypothetical protein